MHSSRGLNLQIFANFGQFISKILTKFDDFLLKNAFFNSEIEHFSFKMEFKMDGGTREMASRSPVREAVLRLVFAIVAGRAATTHIALLGAS